MASNIQGAIQSALQSAGGAAVGIKYMKDQEAKERAKAEEAAKKEAEIKAEAEAAKAKSAQEETKAAKQETSDVRKVAGLVQNYTGNTIKLAGNRATTNAYFRNAGDLKPYSFTGYSGFVNPKPMTNYDLNGNAQNDTLPGYSPISPNQAFSPETAAALMSEMDAMWNAQNQIKLKTDAADAQKANVQATKEALKNKKKVHSKGGWAVGGNE